MSRSPQLPWPRQALPTRVASWLLNPHGFPRPRRLRDAVGGKTVLVTGASFGIGEAAARLLAAAGAKVLLVARSRDQLELIAGEIRALGGTAEVHPADLTDTAAVAELARRVIAAHGAVDVVVSNAGKSIRRSVALSYDRFHDYERTAGVNYLGPVRLLLALLPGMRRRGPGTSSTSRRSGCGCRPARGGGRTRRPRPRSTPGSAAWASRSGRTGWPLRRFTCRSSTPG